MQTRLDQRSGIPAAGFSLLLFLSLMLWAPYCIGQISDTLSGVEVRSQRNSLHDVRSTQFSPGQKLQEIDSATMDQYQFQDLSQLLTQQSPVFLRSYGLNGLATLNFRGSSASQSLVLWNNIPIQNAALGISDISLFPVSMAGNVRLLYGGQGALWGSGSMGGALLIESPPPAFDRQTHATIGMGFGSYQQQQVQGRAGWSSNKLDVSTSVFLQTAKNDFPFRREDGTASRTRHAGLNGATLQSQIAYRSGIGLFRIAGWYQQSHREIPAALFESYSTKQRSDQTLRLMGDWNRTRGNVSMHARTAFISDRMAFDDDTIHLHTDVQSNQFFAEAGLRYRKKRSEWLFFAPVQYLWMGSAEGGDQLRLALAGAYRLHLQRLFITVSARGERIDARSVLLPGLSASYDLQPWMKLKMNLQRTYRAPTLNELYYEPGGNINLQPEHGWGAEAGTLVSLGKNDRWEVNQELTLYSRLIRNWIYWMGGSIWTPHNLAKVHSRGVESITQGQMKLGGWLLHGGLNIAYTRSTTVESYIPNDGSTGKQIPYTPRVNGQYNLGFTVSGFRFNFNHCFTSGRYFNADETGYIRPYQLLNLQLSYTRLVFRRKLIATFQLNNLTGKEYQIMQGRPMPGRNVLGGFQYDLFTNAR